ncbi:excinuclease ABC subunit UvrC [Nitrosophilus alvini]|uniref:excinuclease ABC subunit UvrC n=1 Tax=Nitrosophilus alvini TaxID=2714855 RepID=UPI001909B9A8|nr:excinuclease ABC subunit UvrC [Nitrosophilus alvini]
MSKANEKLKNDIKNLPDKPGVYQYFNKEGRLLYIGKAKSLKKRVKSYFRFSPHFCPAPNLSPRIFKMASEVDALEYIIVENENDALILENSLIKQLKPKYNILLRDDKTYPYIYINMSEEFPRFEITRKVIKGKNIKYFGPLSTAAKDILDSIYELFPLVQKKGCLNQKKACLFYQIKRCSAPCEGKISTKEYKNIVDEAKKYILDKKTLIKKLEAKMSRLSAELRFEEAAEIRDRIERISKSEIQSNIDLARVEDIDIFAVYSEKGKASIVRMFMREGRVISSSSNIIRYDDTKGFDVDEAYKRAILDFYSVDSPITSKKIITAHDFSDRKTVESFLSQKLGKKITISTPKKGNKLNLAKLAILNAKELLKKQSKEKDDILLQVMKLLKLENYPFRIEIFDNSHIKGSIPVGAMAVYENGKFKKNDYRHYNLSSKDEYSQMREILTKRCNSFSKNPPPDLWVIDGGETLRRLAQDILQSFGVDIDVVAISKEKIDAKAYRAKGKAKDLIYTKNELFRLQPTDKRLLFLQKLRDEAHRFAIKFHREQKLKADRRISILKAKGIGEAKLKKLLDYFGSFENIKSASFSDLCSIIDEKSAKNIKNADF